MAVSNQIVPNLICRNYYWSPKNTNPLYTTHLPRSSFKFHAIWVNGISLKTNWNESTVWLNRSMGSFEGTAGMDRAKKATNSTNSSLANVSFWLYAAFLGFGGDALIFWWVREISLLLLSLSLSLTAFAGIIPKANWLSDEIIANKILPLCIVYNCIAQHNLLSLCIHI